MKTQYKTREQHLIRAIFEQRAWIEQHGATLSGYLLRYGSKNDPEHSGNGGEAIYAADIGALHRLEREYDELQKRRRA